MPFLVVKIYIWYKFFKNIDKIKKLLYNIEYTNYRRIRKMKGSKRYKWLKDGCKTSRKWYKSIWNRKIRHGNKVLGKGSFYKKYAKQSMWDGVL